MTVFKHVVLFFGAMLLQWWWSTHFLVLGLAPQLLLVLTVSIAARLGPVPGMCYGFAWGLFLDVMRPQLFGANALALTLVGYGTGAVRRQIDVAGIAPQAVVVSLMAWAFFLFSGLLGLVFEKTFLWVGWAPFLFTPLYDCLLVPFVFLYWERTLRRGL